MVIGFSRLGIMSRSMEKLKYIITMVSHLSNIFQLFRGTYRNGVKICGHFKFLNGYEYQGHCFGNKFYGEGSLIFPSGKIIYG